MLSYQTIVIGNKVVPRYAGRDIRYPVEVRFKSLHDTYYQHKTET